MKTVLLALPYLLSFLMGFCLIHLIFRKVPKPPFLIHLMLAGGLGLGLSSTLIFFTFIIFNSYQRAFVILFHCIIGAGLVLASLFQKDFETYPHYSRKSFTSGIALLLLLCVCLIPLWIQTRYYPMGGWDAWEVWNFKAKFLFTAGEKWTNMFAPMLWRSSPHYPLLLPLVNVWGWTFINEVAPVIPMITSIVFTFLTIGLLLAVLVYLTKSPVCPLAPLLLVTLPFYGILAVSQYCDIVLSFYLLAGLYSLLEISKGAKFVSRYALLSGISLGLLTFTKPEGLVAAGILIFISCLLFSIQHKDRPARKSFFLPFGLALGIGSLATILFEILYSPGNRTCINGLLSESSPVTLNRLKMILGFFLFELKSSKWNGIWILILAGILLNYRACFRREVRILPLFLGFYILTVLTYYFVNTYFEIGWWLQYTLNRILFSLLPVFLLWIFDSFGLDTRKK